ncbi:MAG: calcium-binding protein [Bradymonadales bacterium]
MRSKTRYFKAQFAICSITLVSLWLAFACSNDGTHEEKCNILPYCEDNTRFFCDNNELKSENCLNTQFCEAGECKTKSADCSEDDYPRSCSQNVVTYCKNGEIIRENCFLPKRCVGGFCEEAAECDESYFSPRCEGEKRVTCVEGSLYYSDCPDKMICVATECKPIPAQCGDGKIDAETEVCDDGEQNGEYGKCRKDCQTVSRCGDKIIDSPEEICDDGEQNGEYGKCRSDCQTLSRCGDGILDPPNEECDPPSQDWLISCTKSCKRRDSLFPDTPTSEDYSDIAGRTCTENDLFAKYMFYRERFIGNAAKQIPGFISWGDAPGESIPASHRDPLVDCHTYWSFNYQSSQCGFEDLANAKGSYHWGDATIWLGTMVHWLATEYRMFSLLGWDTSETLQLIASAMAAFNRLDLEAERLFGQTGILNGFFLRDDVPRDFYLKDGQYRFVRTDAPYTGYECAASMTSCERHNNVSAEDLLYGGSFTSQDQLTGIFEGYGMLSKFLVHSTDLAEQNLYNESLAALDRIMRYLLANHWNIGVQTSSAWLQIPDTWGGYAQLFSGLFAGAANQIIGDKLGMQDYHDEISRLSYNGAKRVLPLAWEFWKVENNYNYNIILRVIAYTEIWDESTFNAYALGAGRDIFSLMRALFWDSPLSTDYPLWRIHEILRSAPCAGPCSGSSCQNPKPGWMGENYFLTVKDRFGARYFEGEFNGLDYLLAHNLYFLSYAQKTGHAYSQKLPPPFSIGPSDLNKILNKVENPTQYDAKAPRNASDMHIYFCGRSFADWIRDNSLGLVDIYTLQNRWTCTINGICQITQDQSPYTHKNALIIGSNENDSINVPKGYHHCIASLDGDDSITTAEGHHVIEAGDGNDSINSGNGQVKIYAGAGNDVVRLGAGFNQVYAGAGNDKIYGSVGVDLIDGEAGDDYIDGGESYNQLRGGDGNDIILAANGANTIWGGAGNDKIRTGNGNSTIHGGRGRNFIMVGNGNNVVYSEMLQLDHLYICFGSGQNKIWADWSAYSHCSAPQNSSLHNSCQSDLDAAFCSLDNFNQWH